MKDIGVMDVEAVGAVSDASRRLHVVAPVVLQAVIYVFARALFTVFGHFGVEGREHVTQAPGPIVFAANHSSEWDAILVRVALPLFSRRFSPMYYVSMTRGEYINSGWRQRLYGGRLFDWLGAYPLRRGLGNYAAALHDHIRLLAAGRNVLIFPEGRRTRDGRLGLGHGGVCYLALATRGTVIPVGITGLVRFNLKDFLAGKRRVTIRFGAPVDPDALSSRFTELPYLEGAAHVMQQIARLIDCGEPDARTP